MAMKSGYASLNSNETKWFRTYLRQCRENQDTAQILLEVF
jgi:hypothetical protein